MWHQKVLSALLVACFVNASGGSQVISVTQYQTSTCADRQAPVKICVDCRTLAVCVQTGSLWDTVDVESCNTAEGFFCNEFEGACSTSVSSCNPSSLGNFECNTPGIFPAPHNCREYHMCFRNGNSMLSITMDCAAGAFNPTTGDCSLLLNDTICQTQQYDCSFVGQMAAWPGNNNIYYVCAAEMVNDNRVLRPRMYRCPSNHMFQEGECIQRNFDNTPEGNLPEGSVPYECQRPGLFADPTYCRYYYSCSTDLLAERFQCPDGTYFNSGILTCVMGVC